MIDICEKKNDVDELTEHVAILFNKDMIETVYNEIGVEHFLISGFHIDGLINSLAKAKAKDHPSLSNKAIFKFMDLIEM
jgi:hypothetical protein